MPALGFRSALLPHLRGEMWGTQLSDRFKRAGEK